MDALFRARNLTEVVNKIKTVKTEILDIVFGRKKYQTSSLISWDVKSGTERILKNLKAADPAQIQKTAGKAMITVEAPRFAPKRFIPASKLDSLRRLGDVAPELIADAVNDELTDMKAAIDRTREFQAAKALSGQIVDDAGVVLVDYGFSGTQTPTLAGKAKWTDSESNPLTAIRAWKKIIIQAVGDVSRFVAFCPSDVMDSLLTNPALSELIKYNIGAQVAEQGRIATVAGVEIHEILGSYLDSSAVRHDMVAATYFILVGIAPENAAEMYAPVVDLADPNGVGKGQAASMFFSKSWDEEDPSGRWIKAEARPLPALLKPECVVYAKVQ
jgi:hypothetical protein